MDYSVVLLSDSSLQTLQLFLSCRCRNPPDLGNEILKSWHLHGQAAEQRCSVDDSISSASLCSGPGHKWCSTGKMEPEKGCFLPLIRFEGCERRGCDTDSCSLLPGDTTFKSRDQFVGNSFSSHPPAGGRRKKKKKKKG